MNSNILKQSLQGLLLFILLGFVLLFYSGKIVFINADLGRHIKNGEVISQTFKPFQTNFYSLTEKDYPVINHHWGSGVLFYYIYRGFGFKGISFFYAVVSVLTFLIFFIVTKKLSNFSLAYFFSLLFLPLITNRVEIRPEGLSYFFLAVFLSLLIYHKLNVIRFRWLCALPLIQILWVNTHIFFIFGPLFILIFGMDAFIHQRDRSLTRKYVFLFLADMMCCLVNPAGLEGALIPLTIFKEYGYMLAENQPVIFMQKRFPENHIYPYFEICFAVLVAGLAGCIRRNNWSKFIIPVCIIAGVSLLAWRAVRILALFGYLAMPFAANSWHIITEKGKRYAQAIQRGLLVTGICIIAFGLTSKNKIVSPYYNLHNGYVKIQKHSGWWLKDVVMNYWSMPGLLPQAQDSAEFFLRLNTEGPVFNNYDIGSYLIFYLFPKYRVFVDNRPEAYSSAFFKSIYIPMQEKETVWQEALARYQFNVIYFYRLDMTPWAQTFLIERVKDPVWAPIYVDDFSIIFLRRNDANDPAIRRFELSKEIFSIQPTH